MVTMKGFRSLLLPLLAVPTLAWAAPEDAPGDAPPEKNGPAGGKEFERRLFDKLDIDNSKDITRPEFEAHPRLAKATEEQKSKLFQRLDKNGDGVLKRRELKPPRRNHGFRDRRREGPMTYEQFAEQPRVKKMSEERKRELFHRLDRNNDNILTVEDSRGRHDGPRGNQEGRRNRPGDGSNKGPNRAPIEDKNNDGEISFAEFYDHPRHQKLGEDEAEDRFEAIDQDHNGVLSPAEVAESMPRPDRQPNKRPASKKKNPAPVDEDESEEMGEMMSGE